MCSHLLCQAACQALCVQEDRTKCTLPSGASVSWVLVVLFPGWGVWGYVGR